VLVFTLHDDALELFTEKLSDFLEDGQSEGGLDISHVKGPVEHELAVLRHVEKSELQHKL